MTTTAATANERWSLACAAALVTDGSNGIGHAIMEELVGHGMRVHMCSRNATELEECRQRWVEEKGLQVTISMCDVVVRADRDALMGTIKDVFAGKLNILVSIDMIIRFLGAHRCRSVGITFLINK